MTTQATIKAWFEEGVTEGATHMIVVVDTFDWADYPVYVKPGQDAAEVAKNYDGREMQKVMEIYDLNGDMNEQLSEQRAYHP